MENKKKEIKIAYKIEEEVCTYPVRNSDGIYYMSRIETFVYGLFTNIDFIEVNLQDYEILFDIEKKIQTRKTH